MDFSAFRGLTQYLMTDKMSVKRLVSGGVDPWGAVLPDHWETIYTDIKCRVSQMNQNFDNPNTETNEYIPVLYKLKVFAPQNIVIKSGDLITLTRIVDGNPVTYTDKKASDYMQYDNHIEFYIGIKEEA